MTSNLEIISNIEIKNELKNFDIFDSEHKIKDAYSTFFEYHVLQSRLSNAKKPLDIERATYKLNKAFVIAHKKLDSLNTNEKINFLNLVKEKMDICMSSKDSLVQLKGILVFESILSSEELLNDEKLKHSLSCLVRNLSELKNKYSGMEDEGRDTSEN